MALAPELSGLGTLHVPVSTTTPQAQRFFDQRAWSRADITLASFRIMSDDRAERYVTLPTGVRMNFVERGDPRGTPVVLLHGYTDSRHSYDRLLSLLPSSLHVFALTQRGHGDSSKPETGYAPSDFAADVAAFLDAQGLDSAVIVGHSMGSTVAQRFAIAYPSRTRALVLEGAFFPKPKNEAITGLWQTVAALTDPIDPKVVRECQASTLARPVPMEFFEMVVGESVKVPAGVWQAALEPFLTIDFAEQLREIWVPTLLVWGDRDAFTQRPEQDALNRAIAGSRLIVYAGTGHSPHWEEPERFAQDLAAFLRTVDAR